ncbi:hypothetical protein DMUE_1536 [Dictyocoela muelleri]|nr:hypothetical protein DMUE_1536 [Dictyocoela muelleri]
MEQEFNDLHLIFDNITHLLFSRGCLYCGSSLTWHSKKGYMVRCRWKHCSKKYSLFSNTIFSSNYEKNIVKLFILKKWLSGSSVGEIQRWTLVSRHRVYKLLRKISKLNIVDKYYAYFDKIGGGGIIVEVDESKFGKRKYERGHKVDGVWILGAVERSYYKRIILKSCKTKSMNKLECFLKTFVKMDSVIFSDGWRGLSNIKNFFIDHKVVNHSKEFVDSTTGTDINTHEGCWSAIKYFFSPQN